MKRSHLRIESATQLKTVLTGFVCVLCLLFLGPPCVAQELVLTGNDARAPKIFNDANGVAHGVLIEIMHFVQKETGHSFTYKLYPWARAYKSAVAGEAGIIGLSLTKERQAVFDYTEEPLFYDELVLVVKAGNEFPFASIDDLRGKKIGACRGCSYGDAFENAVRDKVFELVQGSNATTQLAMLLYGRIDAVLITVGKAGFEEALRDKSSNLDLLKDRDKFAILPKPFARDPNYLAFAKTMGKKDLLVQVDQVLKKGHASGAIQKLIDRYIAGRK